jgi:murein L,D-transpeptidase YcbB/YkuD
MNYLKSNVSLISFVFVFFLLAGCHTNVPTNKPVIVSTPEKMDKKTSETISNALEYALQHNGDIGDTIRLQFTGLVNNFYKANDDNNVWSHQEKWEPLADSLYQFIEHAELSGLFSNDYHFKKLRTLKDALDMDSVKRTDANLWTKADLMLTDGFMHLVKDLKQGRLNKDSISYNKKELSDSFYSATLTNLFSTKQLTEVLNGLQPKEAGYWALKNCIPGFIDSMDKRIYTYVTYPLKPNDEKDSLSFIKNLQQRLSESKCIAFTSILPDTLQLKLAIKKYQHLKNIRQDGKISATFIKILNGSDAERFKRIALTLDRYKQLPDSMPEKYIWVNLPAYYMQLWDHDTVVINSKIICGKPATRTPLLNSYITDMVTYPTWTVPNSIIVKQYLPKLKNNPNYLTSIGLHLVDSKGETVSGNDVKWSKYSKGIPYKIMQGSGDDNALGILKFNFSNAYAVYLHDTNQRYLFKNAVRSLSHGCVRVQEWQKLAFYIARNDSMNVKPGETLHYTTDSIMAWLDRKENKRIGVKNKISLFIRYFTCEAKNGKIKFYDDIYGEDKFIREKYFTDK